ncbi:MAG: hypothetical protein WC866_01690 [Patescibacteria group bacterium]|jgi:hypothetical protein
MKHYILIATAIVVMGAGCISAPETPVGAGGAAGTQLEGTPPVNDTPDAKIMAPQRAEDAVYVIDGKPVTLRDGKAQIFLNPGMASSETVRIFGTPVRTDLDGDSDADAAVLLEQDKSGSGRFYYVAAAIAEDGYVQGTNAILLGDRIAPQTLETQGGLILANFAVRKPGEPMTTQPSVGVTERFRIENGELVSVKP